MGTHVFGLGFLAVGCCGALVLLAVVGVILFLVLRKKQPPRGFDVEPKR